jgi:hypothetical protein
MKLIRKGYSLVFIISGLVMSSVIISVFTSIYSAYKVSKVSLIESHLHSNEQYEKNWLRILRNR